MILCFELSMPNIGSWNSRWSGENDYYAKIVHFGRGKKADTHAKEILDKGYFHYNFGDGWSAGIRVKKVDAREATKIRRKSKGFCGYEWMIESIRHNLVIMPSD